MSTTLYAPPLHVMTKERPSLGRTPLIFGASVTIGPAIQPCPLDPKQLGILACPRDRICRPSELTGADRHRLDLDDRPETTPLDVKMWRHMVVGIDRDLTCCKAANGWQGATLKRQSLPLCQDPA